MLRVIPRFGTSIHLLSSSCIRALVLINIEIQIFDNRLSPRDDEPFVFGINEMLKNESVKVLLLD